MRPCMSQEINLDIRVTDKINFFRIALYVAIYSHITAFDNDLKYNFCNTFGK